MNKTKIIAISIIAVLALTIALGAYQYTNLTNQSNITINSLTAQTNYLINHSANLTIERDNLKEDVNSLINQRDSAWETYWETQEALIIANNDIDFLTNERGYIKNELNSVITQRDQANTKGASLEELLTIANNDISSLTDERNNLKNDIQLISYRINELEYIQSYAIDRIVLVGGVITDTGSAIKITGAIINAGLNDVTGVGYHFQGWDLLGELCINITTNLNGDLDTRTSIETGQYKEFSCTLDYTPYALSRYAVTPVCDDSTT